MFASLLIGRTALAQSGSTPLSTHLRAQETSDWCWAASAEMVMETLGKRVPQCEQARSQGFCSSDCCGNPTPLCCIQSGWPQFEKFSYDSKYFDRALTWDELKTELGVHRRPVAFSYHHSRGSGVNHMMVAYGFEEHGLIRLVHVLDPWPPRIGDCREISYSEYINTPTTRHWRDYFEVQVSANPRPPQAATWPAIGVTTIALAPKDRDAPPAPVGAAPQDAVTKSREQATQEIKKYQLPDRIKLMNLTADTVPTLGDPLPVIWLGLDDVLQAEGKLPGQLQRRVSTQVSYPVIAAKQILRAFDVHSNGGQWNLVNSANASMMQLLAKQQHFLATTQKMDPQTMFEVSIPGLNLFFVGGDRRENGKVVGLTLLPVIDYPTFDLSEKQVVEAEAVFPRIYDAASKLRKQTM